MFEDHIRVRRIAPGDEADLKRFYEELSPESRQLRFHAAGHGITPAAAAAFASADHAQRDGFVAVMDARIVGHLVLEPLSEGIEELAVAVDDRAQRTGVGTLLMAAAVASARIRHGRRRVAWGAGRNTRL